MTALAHRGPPATPTALDALVLRWRGWTLARQFAVCASLVLLPVMALTGSWVTSLTVDQVTRSSATAAALYIESVVDPLVQELGTGDRISPANIARLERLLDETSLGLQVHSFVIWLGDGRVVFASHRELIGKTLPVSARQRAAWQGTVSASYNKLVDAEYAAAAARSSADPLTEVYVPVRERGSARVIAVAELYQNSHNLRSEVADARRRAWLRIGGISLAMLTALFFIVRQGSQTIETQREALETRIDDLVRLLRENAGLRARVEQASARASESNEFYLKRLGADLHDGPAQLLGLALLALDDNGAALKKVAARQGPSTAEIIAQALRELRQVASGLAIPEITTMTVEAAIRAAVRRHEQLSGTCVAVDLAALPRDATQALKICIYRVVQEGLTNAVKHAGGAGQCVRARCEGGLISVEVADSGLGGEFEVTSLPGIGTRIAVRLPLVRGEQRHGC
jgi:signal transduction histidine kinase